MLWQMSTGDWIVSFAFMCGMAYIVGWFCDRIMNNAGFGHLGNWLVILIGAYGGMFAYNVYGYNLEAFPQWTLGVILGSSFMTLFLLSALKRVFSA